MGFLSFFDKYGFFHIFGLVGLFLELKEIKKKKVFIYS